MEMIIGRLGDQEMVINDMTVSRKHCKMKESADGSIFIENLSPNGVYLNGTRVDNATVKKTDVLGLGPNFKASVADLMVRKTVRPSEPENLTDAGDSLPVVGIDAEAAKTYTNYTRVFKDYKRYAELKGYCTAVEQCAGSLPKYVLPSVKAAIACKCIHGGKFSEAQKLLYEAGDEIYPLLDMSPEMEGCYASILTLLADLYMKVFRYDEAYKTARAATGIFNRWTPGDLYIYPHNVADAYSVLGDASAAIGEKPQASKCFCRSIELYRQSGMTNPARYTAKIAETETKLKSLHFSENSKK